MKKTHVTYLAPSHCKYRFGGVNLHEMRRARLRKIAGSLRLPVADEDGRDHTHNELLGAIIHRLDTLEAPAEITELQSQQEAKKTEAPAKPKKAKKKAAKK